MQFETAESEYLFKADPLIYVQELRAVVGLPLDELPGEEELDLLSKILKALGLKPKAIRFVYFSGQPDAGQVPETDVFLLYFKASSSGEIQPEMQKNNDRDVILLPSLRHILASADLKRSVWNAIRPFSER